MRITLISASPRTGSQSSKVTQYLASLLEGMGEVSTASILDLATINLPLYDSDTIDASHPAWHTSQEVLSASDGFVFITPEWDGMFSAALHNLFHYVKHELADKPVYLVGVSSGRGGRYPLLQLRQMGYKNKRFVIIPESLFVDQVKENLVDGEMQNEHIAERAQYGLKTLTAYAQALRSVRESGVIDYKQFPNGW